MTWFIIVLVNVDVYAYAVHVIVLQFIHTADNKRQQSR